MDEINKIKKQKRDRFLFLKELWERTEGDENKLTSDASVGESLGFSLEKSRLICQYLAKEGLIYKARANGSIGIKHEGVIEIEEALSNPDKPTEHFLPQNIFIQGSNNIVVSGSNNRINSDDVSLFDFSKVYVAIDNSQLGNKEEVKTEVQRIENECNSKEPNHSVVKKSWDFIKKNAGVIVPILEPIIKGVWSKYFGM